MIKRAPGRPQGNPGAGMGQMPPIDGGLSALTGLPGNSSLLTSKSPLAPVPGNPPNFLGPPSTDSGQQGGGVGTRLIGPPDTNPATSPAPEHNILTGGTNPLGGNVRFLGGPQPPSSLGLGGIGKPVTQNKMGTPDLR